jgi:hypothetical protein
MHRFFTLLLKEGQRIAYNVQKRYQTVRNPTVSELLISGKESSNINCIHSTPYTKVGAM